MLEYFFGNIGTPCHSHITISNIMDDVSLNCIHTATIRHGASAFMTCSISAKVEKIYRLRASWIWVPHLFCSSSKARPTKTLWSLIPKEECSGEFVPQAFSDFAIYLLHYRGNTVHPPLIKYLEPRLNPASLQRSLIASHGFSFVRM